MASGENKHVTIAFQGTGEDVRVWGRIVFQTMTQLHTTKPTYVIKPQYDRKFVERLEKVKRDSFSSSLNFMLHYFYFAADLKTK